MASKVLKNQNNYETNEVAEVSSLKSEKREKQIQLALQYMKKLGVCEDFIAIFKKEQEPCWYENMGFCAAGFWVFQDKDLQSKIKAWEKETGNLVWGVIKNLTEFGEQYSFLYIPSDLNESNEPCSFENGTYEIFSYVWNKSDDVWSEYGYIGIKSLGGGIARVF